MRVQEWVSDRKRDRGQDGVVLRQYAALPWRKGRSGLEVMMVTSRGRGRWIVPKGWIMKGRTPWESAATEAFEEAGVFGRMDKTPIGRYRCEWIGENGETEPREVVVYGLEVRATLLNWLEMDQRRRVWVSPEEAVTMAGDPGLSILLRRWACPLAHDERNIESISEPAMAMASVGP